MGLLLEMRTVEDLHRAIQLQRTVSRNVTQEIDELIKGVSTEENQHDDEYHARIMMQREQELLIKYAHKPTLIEHERFPALRLGEPAGATFGVATVMGEVMLANVRALTPVFPRAHRTLFFVMLNEISKPNSDDGDLIDTFMRAMTIELKDQDWSVTEQERKRLLRAMITPLAEAMVMVALQYGMIDQVRDGGYVITSVGARVLLHLFSAQKFIEAISEAHTRLQKSHGQRSEIQHPPQP
jgi:hypothetical protein